MKRIIYFLIIFFIFDNSLVYADIYSSVMNDDIKNSINNSFEIISDDFGEDIDALGLIEEINNGKFDTGLEKLFVKIKTAISNELKNSLSVFVKAASLIMLVSVIMILYPETKKLNVTELVCISVVILFLLDFFYGISNTVVNTVDTLSLFINSLIPILMTLTASAGKIATAGVLSPVMLGVSSVITLIIKTVIIPLVMLSLALNLANSATGKANLSVFGNQIHSLNKWLIGLMLTIYMGVVSIVGTATPKIDDITLKTAKYAVGSFIPYVGGMLSDSVELVLNCSTVVKNSVGIVGLIGIISVVAIPCLQLTLKVLMFKLLSVLISPVSTKPVIDCMNSISSGLSIMLGLIFVVSVMYILSVTVIIYIGGA